MKKPFAALLAGLAMMALPAAITPVAPMAHADVCTAANAATDGAVCPPGTVPADVGSIALADGADEARQRAEGLPPCYTSAGVPYYTPGDMPCA
ncbi:MAG: hypothetical protein K2Q25_09385 [Mycobacteriaceae bacterium]|nr:hypothetical protein [Mycobacteriaceae bacterium]